MKAKPAATLLILVAALLVIHFPILVVAQASASLQTDRGLYTPRDKQILLQGDGYTPSKLYVIWVQTPGDNSTHVSGHTFIATPKGEIPPAVSLPIEPDSPLGTYLLSISDTTLSDAKIARAHYGVWGTDKYVYQRTEVVQARGGGVLPKTSLKVTIRNPTAAFVYDSTIAANGTGAFLAAWRIPPDAITESYTVFIDGVGTYDTPNLEFVSIWKFSVTPAVLNITVHTQPALSYERTQTASAEFAIRYPDSTGVPSMREGIKPVALYAGQFKIADLSLTMSDTSGIWTAQSRITMNASLDVRYKFLLLAGAFGDGYGNIGPEKDVETVSFSVTPAKLLVSASFNSTHYQVPFDTLVTYARVGYPDGRTVGNATVRAWLTAGNSIQNVTVTHDVSGGVWIVKYSFSWDDMFRLGEWRLFVKAVDMYGNEGSESFQVAAEPYALLEILIAAIVAVLVARWLLSKFWRRLYLATKHAASTLRGRLKAPPLDSYFSNSPVAP
jgi:hypothetical protein